MNNKIREVPPDNDKLDGAKTIGCLFSGIGILLVLLYLFGKLINLIR